MFLTNKCFTKTWMLKQVMLASMHATDFVFHCAEFGVYQELW